MMELFPHQENIMATEKMTLQEKLAASADKKAEDPKKEEQKANTAPSYKAGRLRSFVSANGTMVRPDADGVYHPKNKEELDALAYYDSQRLNYVHKL
jgi:hypothetical protein